MPTFCSSSCRLYTRVFPQLVSYSEVCSERGRVNIHLEYESVISYEIVAICSCYLMYATYSDTYRHQTTLDTGDFSDGLPHNASRRGE
jgi:hypothetical protein